MKIKIILIGIFFFLYSGSGFAQEVIQVDQKTKRFNVIQFHLLPGSKQIGAGFKYKSLHSLADVFHIGWGVGIDGYSAILARNFIPLTLELLGDLSSTGPTPFYSLSIGYGIALPEEASFADKASGGIIYNIAFGYRNKSAKHQPFVSVGYRGQMASYIGIDRGGDDNKSVVYKRWNIAIGTFF